MGENVLITFGLAMVGLLLGEFSLELAPLPPVFVFDEA
jgi:hypothetical protein